MTHQHSAGFGSALRRTAAALTLAVASAAALSAQTFEYEGMSFTVNSDDSAPTCSVSEGNYGLSGKVTIPSVAYYEGKPYTVTSIGNNAFACLESITAVEMPSTVTSIEEGAFSSCSGLAQVTFSKSLDYIGYAAFYSCNSLTEIEMPATVTSIDAEVFRYCDNLVAINMEKGSLIYVSVDGVLFDAQGVCLCPEGKTGSFSIPEQTALGEVTAIGFCAFYDCSKLTDIIIPEGISLIDNHAFNGCGALEEINIPASVTNIGYDAFTGCVALAAINVAEGNSSYQSINGLLYGSDGLIKCPPRVEGVCSLPAWCGVGGGALTAIAEYAFQGCSELTGVDIPDTVELIDYGAFEGCIRLEEIEIPTSVLTVGSGVFASCWSLKTMTVHAVTPPSVKPSFGECIIGHLHDEHVVYVPDDSFDAYVSAKGWSKLNLMKMSEKSALDEVRGAEGEAVDVYTLQGVCVKRGAGQADVDALPAGLYLVGGQKRLVR